MRTAELNLTITQNRPILNSIAQKFTSDPYEKEELVQETFIRSLNSLEKFIHNPKLVAWLFTIMKNIYINKYRRQAKYRSIEADIQNTPHFESISRNKGESKFVMEDIQGALSKLPESNYKAFTMFVEGYKYNEIADYLQVPEGTVKTRIHMARKLLKEDLKGYTA
ncbi:RNA polymerase sigma-70 factor, ECF subfamily [Sphingobacterium nematocida]|uniref:RNA polymerase sigma-70 factor, ECF subfamily n=1 Tax=Sphingobacterium nematocida TaxID=1513896 RepID=A0A1T5AR24_9SPHI|nr:RNA polymerase sigma factor [Sphingobacterium nematocida]SKB37491.1 RNA polymerase sigma-70 factor, ECF subfamily [Sphingobacterium nematocida]